jgi:hypothetical protein
MHLDLVGGDVALAFTHAHTVRVAWQNDQHWNSMIAWCRDNVHPGEWDYDNSVFYFTQQDHATQFALAWA